VKIVFTLQARENFKRSIDFLKFQGVPEEKIEEIAEGILARIDSLKTRQFLGQAEDYLAHLSKHHRRLIEGPYKIIYYIENESVYITDIFDSRQHSSGMKG
jgi:toxin ParE1/3/4